MDTTEFATFFLYFCGLYCIFHILKFIFLLIHAYILPKLGFGCNLRKYGEWAVVTGATDGIGKEYALQLAEKGFSIVLISRSKEKLDKVAEEITSKYKVMTKTITYDFCRTDGYDMIENQLKGLDIGILINNVGTGSPSLIGHDDCDLNSLFSNININICSAVGMTHIATKVMSYQKRGLIIHISSLWIELNVPLAACYASTKLFLHKFSRSLSFDNGGKIHHQVVAPGDVVTKLNQVNKGILSPMPDTFVKSALGTAGRLSFTHGYWAHDVLSLIMSFIPDYFLVLMAMKSIEKSRRKTN